MEQCTQKTIYLDMDGVVADWNKMADSILGHHPHDPGVHYPDEEWAEIVKVERFYQDLDVLDGAEELVTVARKFRDNLGWRLLFLTAISRGNDMPWATWDKCLWAQKHFPDIPVHIGPYAPDKKNHCLPGDILVDDRPSNIVEWGEKNGIGILADSENIHATTEKLELLYNEQHALTLMIAK